MLTLQECDVDQFKLKRIVRAACLFKRQAWYRAGDAYQESKL
jgi:hypothetical protein